MNRILCKSKLKESSYGYTIIEFVVTVIIMGVLAAAAVPSYQTQVRKLKAREAEKMLRILYAGQIEYERDNPGSYATSMSDLDYAIGTPNPKNFDSLTVNDADNVNCSGPTSDYLASVRVIDGNFNLYVLENGDIVCKPCPGSLCRKMGYSSF